jgi:hypothetical protein
MRQASRERSSAGSGRRAPRLRRGLPYHNDGHCSQGRDRAIPQRKAEAHLAMRRKGIMSSGQSSTGNSKKRDILAGSVAEQGGLLVEMETNGPLAKGTTFLNNGLRNKARAEWGRTWRGSVRRPPAQTPLKNVAADTPCTTAAAQSGAPLNLKVCSALVHAPLLTKDRGPSWLGVGSPLLSAQEGVPPLAHSHSFASALLHGRKGPETEQIGL